MGTILMTAGFNLVLYSRLNHITQNKALLRAVLVSIAVACAVGKIPVVVSESIPTAIGQGAYRKALYLDVILTIEGFFLCGLYIYLFRRKFIQGLSPSRRTKSFFRILIVAQSVVAVVDVAANVLLFMDYYLPGATTTPLRYAIKVKIEFVILNRLVRFTQRESSSILQPYITSNEEYRFQQRLDRAEILHQQLSRIDQNGPHRITESQNNHFVLKRPGYPMLKRNRSLPDLSLYDIIDGQRIDLVESGDQWSITDIQYLGRFH
jgi:hypothetical protein